MRVSYQVNDDDDEEEEEEEQEDEIWVLEFGKEENDDKD